MSSADESVEFDQRGLLRLIRRHLLALVAFAILGLLVAGALTVLGGKSYSSSAQLEIGPPLTLDSLLGSTSTTSTSRGSASSSTTDSGIVAAEAGFLGGKDMQNRVEARLRPDHPAYTVSATPVSSSDVVGIAVTSSDGKTAQDVASTYVSTYLDYVAANNKNLIATAQTQLTNQINALNQRIADVTRPLQTATSSTLPQVEAQVGATRDALVQRSVVLQSQLDNVQLTQTASPSGQTRLASPATPPVASSRALPLAIGLIGGLLVGLVFAALREFYGGRVLDEADVAASVSAPLLADLRVSVPRKLGRNPFTDNAEEDEAYRALAASLWPQHRDTTGRTIWMVSSATRDGAAALVLVVRLARQLSRLGRRVIILNADEWPGRTAGQAGLAEVIRDPQSMPKHVLSYESGRVLVLPKSSEGSQDALASPEFAPVLKQIAERVDVVLFLSSPLLASADPLMLAPLCDGVLLAVERRATRRRTLSLVGRRLERLPIDSALGGVVLQGGRNRNSSGGGGRRQLVAPTEEVVKTAPSRNRAGGLVPRSVQPQAFRALRSLRARG